jgi:nicotinamide riboside transporter PnuC
MLAWSVLSLLFLLSLVIIGLRRWEGWIFAVITNVGWIVYSLVGGVRVVELVINSIGLLISVIFLVRWRKDQRAKDEAELDEPVAARVG